MQNYVFKEEFLNNLPSEDIETQNSDNSEKMSRSEGCFRLVFINTVIFTVIVLCALVLKFAAPKAYASIKSGYNIAVHTEDITFKHLVSFFEKIGNFVFSDNDNIDTEASSQTPGNETSSDIAQSEGAGGEDVKTAPQNVSEKAYVLTSKICAVTNGTVTSEFGWRIHPIFKSQGFHTGIDIANKEGTPIKTAFSGSVYEVGQSRAYGNYVIMRHSDTLYTFYGHCKSIKVRENMNMRQGEVIALMGSTGYSTGPHLHFEIRINEKSVDPAYVLKGIEQIEF